MEVLASPGCARWAAPERLGRIGPPEVDPLPAGVFWVPGGLGAGNGSSPEEEACEVTKQW
jgi:hypothetical protein